MGILDLFRNKKENTKNKVKKKQLDHHERNNQLIDRKTILVKYKILNENRFSKENKDAIVAGLDAWSKCNNHKIKFARAKDKAPLCIKYKQLISGAGNATLSTFPRGIINLDMKQLMTHEQIRDSVAHEFGHILGYGHTQNNSKLMYGSSDFKWCRPKNKKLRLKIPEPLYSHRDAELAWK